MFKRVISVLLLLSMALCLVACNYNPDKSIVVATADEESTLDEVSSPDSMSFVPTDHTSSVAFTEPTADTTAASTTRKDEDKSQVTHNTGNSANHSSGTVSGGSTYKPSTVNNGTTIETLLNKAPLNPMKTNCPSLDRMVSSVFSRIHKPSMSTYEKVKACYDYLIDTVTYDFCLEKPDDAYKYQAYYDEKVVEDAYGVLKTNIGTCVEYSAAFMVMCRAIGLDAYVAGGGVISKSGGYTGHKWSLIKLNGTYYVFDPQVQSNNMHIPYYFFGKTYSQLGDMYKFLSDLSYDPIYFCNFKKAYDFQIVGGDFGLVLGESCIAKTSGLPEGTKITWKSENTDIVTVDSTGKVTSVGEGRTVIYAEALVGIWEYDTYCYVEVIEGELIRFYIADKIEYPVCCIDDITVSIIVNPYKYPEGLPPYTIEFSSSNPDVAKFIEDELWTINAGTTVITAKLVCEDGLTAITEVPVVVGSKKTPIKYHMSY